MMILQGVRHQKPYLGVCYANDPKKGGGSTTPAPALDWITFEVLCTNNRTTPTGALTRAFLSQRGGGVCRERTEEGSILSAIYGNGTNLWEYSEWTASPENTKHNQCCCVHWTLVAGLQTNRRMNHGTQWYMMPSAPHKHSPPPPLPLNPAQPLHPGGPLHQHLGYPPTPSVRARSSGKIQVGNCAAKKGGETFPWQWQWQCVANLKSLFSARLSCLIAGIRVRGT